MVTGDRVDPGPYSIRWLRSGYCILSRMGVGPLRCCGEKRRGEPMMFEARDLGRVEGEYLVPVS